jgi:hypothetical protein
VLGRVNLPYLFHAKAEFLRVLRPAEIRPWHERDMGD